MRLEEGGGLGGMDQGRQGSEHQCPQSSSCTWLSCGPGWSLSLCTEGTPSHRQVAGSIGTQGAGSASAPGPHPQGCPSGMQGPGLQEGKKEGVPSCWGWGSGFWVSHLAPASLPFPQEWDAGLSRPGHPFTALSELVCISVQRKWQCCL